MIARGRKLRILILLLVVLSLASLVPCTPAIIASTAQRLDTDTSLLYATVPDVEWEKTFGYSKGEERGNSVQQTTDGGYIIVGTTFSLGAGCSDLYLIKIDASGNQEWSKTFGGVDSDEGTYVQQTMDGGYIITGYIWSADHISTELYLLKTDASGNQEWSKTFGETGTNAGVYVQQTTDGGYIIIGNTWPFGTGSFDIYIIKADASGNQEWSKTFGGSNRDSSYAGQQTSDGGYVVVGYTASFSDSAGDLYLLKINASGNQEWIKTFGGSGNDVGSSIQETKDGGFIIVGTRDSGSIEHEDVYLIRTDSTGNEKWSKLFDSSGYENGYCVRETSDGGFIIVGKAYPETSPNEDVYIIRTDSLGNISWTKTIGGSLYDSGNCVQQTSDGGFIIVGETSSFGNGNGDIYLIKLYSELAITTSTMTLTPTPTPTPTPTDAIMNTPVPTPTPTFSLTPTATSTPTPPISLPSPQLGTPSAGVTVSDNTPLFTWAGVTEASNYRLQVSADSGFSANSLILNITLGNVQAYESENTLNDGTYYWRVEAANDYSESTWSSTGSFTISTVAEQKAFPLWIIGAIGGGIALVVVVLGIRWNNKRMAGVGARQMRLKQLKAQVHKWEDEGYDVSKLKDLFK